MGPGQGARVGGGSLRGSAGRGSEATSRAELPLQACAGIATRCSCCSLRHASSSAFAHLVDYLITRSFTQQRSSCTNVLPLLLRSPELYAQLPRLTAKSWSPSRLSYHCAPHRQSSPSACKQGRGQARSGGSKQACEGREGVRSRGPQRHAARGSQRPAGCVHDGAAAGTCPRRGEPPRALALRASGIISGVCVQASAAASSSTPWSGSRQRSGAPCCWCIPSQRAPACTHPQTAAPSGLGSTV